MLCLRVFLELNRLVIMEWLIIILVGESGLILLVLLLSVVMVLCMVVRLMMYGIFVKFCMIMCVGVNWILVLGFVVVF